LLGQENEIALTLTPIKRIQLLAQILFSVKTSDQKEGTSNMSAKIKKTYLIATGPYSFAIVIATGYFEFIAGRAKLLTNPSNSFSSKRKIKSIELKNSCQPKQIEQEP